MLIYDIRSPRVKITAEKQKKNIHPVKPKKILAIFTILFLILQFFAGLEFLYPKQAKAAGTIYYVDSSITDTNPASATPDFTTYNPTTFATDTGSASVYKTIADVNLKSFSAGDSILFRKGQTWREQLTVPSSGSAGLPITFGAYGTGDDPIINAANEITGWSVYSGTTYQKALTTQPKQVFKDSARATKGASKDTLNDHEWFWVSNVLYFRDDSGSPTGIEASYRNYAVKISRSYITLTNLDLRYSNLYDNLLISTQNSSAESNIIVDGITSTAAYAKGILIDANGYDISNVTVMNSTISGSGLTGIYVGSTANNITGTLIENNTTHDNSYRSDIIYTAGIKVFGTTVTNTVIQNNLSYSNGVGKPTEENGMGIWYDTVGSGNIARYNTTYSNNQDGIMIEKATGASVYYNLSYSNYRAGVYVDKNTHDNLIYNNTLYGNGYGIYVWSYAPVAGEITGNIFKNNIADGNTTRELSATTGGENDGTYGSGNIYTYNNFGAESSNFIEWGAGVYKSTYDAWETAYGGTTNSIESDPLFTNAAGNDFTLQSTSPAINTGTNLGSDYDDGLSPSSSWPSSVTTIDQDLRGSGWEIGAYVYPVPQAPTIGTPSSQSTSIIRWAFADNSDDETGFRVYDNLGAIATSSATAGLSSLDETGLSVNTQYTGRYAVAYNTYGNSASSSVATSKYTLAGIPSGLSGTAGLTTMDLSVDALPNPTAGSSGYYFSRSGANSSWLQTNSWSDSGLTCGTSYTYSVIYHNGDGTETTPTSLTKSTNSCPGGGMPPEWNNPPKAPTGGFGVSINNGVESTAIPTVILNLKGGSDTAKMAISNFSDFRDAGQENYASTKQWNLCQGLASCTDGTYAVYARFYTSYGQSSQTISDSIVLQTNSTSSSNPSAEANAGTQPSIPSQPSAPSQQQNQPSVPFTKYLRYGQVSADVKRLQIFLNQNSDIQVAKSGVGSLRKETNIFGYLTKTAVIKFQEKYTEDILAPWKLTKGTGFVGKTTIAKINKLLGF